jgi:hypothetical protein
MKRIFIIIPYNPEGYLLSQDLLQITLQNVIFELSSSKSFEIQENTINILLEERYVPLIQQSLLDLFDFITFRFITDSFLDIDEWNHRLNTYIQRAAVSSGVDYLLVISGILPIFNNSIFSKQISWDSDINLGLSQSKSTEFILFKKNYIPFFFRLSDSSIITGERNKNLFQQYKKDITVIYSPIFLTIDKSDEIIFETIKQTLKKGRNVYQKKFYDLVKS